MCKCEWMEIETAPKDGRTLLLGYFNSHDKWRTMRGQWFSQDVIDEEWEEPDMAGEGWYETSVENDDMPNCWWTEPTHWMPLPPPPNVKGGVMKVEINYVKWLKAELRKINRQPFEKIVWLTDGAKQEYPAHVLENWRYIGLSNVEFPEFNRKDTQCK